jgi:hypothetical protein
VAGWLAGGLAAADGKLQENKQRLKARFVGVHRTGSMPDSLPPRAVKRLALSRCTKACRACLSRALHSSGPHSCSARARSSSTRVTVLRMVKSRLQHQAASIQASSGDKSDAPVVVLRLALRSLAWGRCTALLSLNPSC